MSLIAVAMSGGVDSSVAALLLLESGHDVVGLTMRTSADSDAPGEAAAVCDVLGIPHETRDLSAEFEECVVRPYADAYAAGLTPNPCVVCNDVVKMGLLAQSAPAPILATGHYARIDSSGPGCRLLKGAAPAKDQSYFLYRIGPARLGGLMFPVGSMTKTEVRRVAARAALPVSGRPESQEACFDGGRPYDEILRRLRPDSLEPGPIIDTAGTVLGEHRGIGRYTVGQRKGLGVSAREPLYVIALDVSARTVTVGVRRDAETERLRASHLEWHDEAMSGRCTFRHRHGQAEHAGRFEVDGDVLTVEFEERLTGVAPGQSVVCYKGDVVLGGGVIGEAG